MVMNIVIDQKILIIMHKEVAFQVTARAHLTKCISMMKMNTFDQRKNLALVEKDQEKEKTNQPSTSIAKEPTPSAHTAAAAPTAAGGGKRKRIWRKGMAQFLTQLLSASKISMIIF